MQSRYSCSLQQDQLLLQGCSSLAPHLAAAVMARSGEKEVWEELQQVGCGVVLMWVVVRGWAVVYCGVGADCGACDVLQLQVVAVVTAAIATVSTSCL